LMYKKVTIGKKEKLKEMGLYFMTADMYYIVEILILLYYTLVIVILEISLIPGDIFVAMLRELEQNYILDCMMGDGSRKSDPWKGVPVFIEILEENGIHSNEEIQSITFIQLEKVHKACVDLLRSIPIDQVNQGIIEMNYQIDTRYERVTGRQLKELLWNMSMLHVYEDFVYLKPELLREMNEVLPAIFSEADLQGAMDEINVLETKLVQVEKDPWLMFYKFSKGFSSIGEDTIKIVFPQGQRGEHSLFVFSSEDLVDVMMNRKKRFPINTKGLSDFWAHVLAHRLHEWYIGGGLSVMSDYMVSCAKLNLDAYAYDRKTVAIFEKYDTIYRRFYYNRSEIDKGVDLMVTYQYENKFSEVENEDGTWGISMIRRRIPNDSALVEHWIKTKSKEDPEGFRRLQDNLQDVEDLVKWQKWKRIWDESSYFKRGCITIKDWFVK
jgi:hypothetical protein